MKKYLIITSAFLIVLLFIVHSDKSAQAMEAYCQHPPFVSTTVEPTLLFVTDASGSMGWEAYSYEDRDDNGDGILDGYDPTHGYEGYFDPSKTYGLDGDGVYQEATATGDPCECTCDRWRCRNWDWGGCEWHGGGCRRWGCCDNQVCTGDCSLDTGNYLNYLHMARIDLVRWAMTGGAPSTCTGAKTFNNGECDPELWEEPGNDVKVGSVCNDSLDVDGNGTADGGCILLSNDGTKVKVRWDRVYAGLAFLFAELKLKPMMAIMFYSGTSVRAEKVYIGDFTAPNSTDDDFPYMNLITHMNSVEPNSFTPTGPAMWDAFNYYAQKAPEYGGFTVQSGEGDRWRNPMYVCEQGGANCKFVPCSSNFILLMSDGQWNRGGGPPAVTACSIDDGFESHSADPVVPAYKMHMGFKNVVSNVDTKVKGIYTIGIFLGGTGEQSMKNVSMYGSFDNDAKTWPSNLSGYPDDTCNMEDCGNGKGSACEPLPTSSPDWDEDGDSVPDGFFSASDALEIKNAVLDVILDILRRASSGTAASVLASGEGTGANLVQAIFYPSRTLGGADIEWTGTMHNLWYHIDPFLGNSTIREDTIEDKNLYVDQDYILHFFFDPDEKKTKADLFKDDNGDGVADDPINPTSTVYLEGIKNLWEAAIKLWEKDPNARTIYTTADGSTRTTFTTPVSSGSPLIGLLQAENSDVADKIVSYTRGIDYNDSYCSVSVLVSCTTDADCPAGEECVRYRNRTVTLNGETHTWKLGDIINSTPRLVSWIPINSYHKTYGDNTYEEFTESADYVDRGMVFVGSNAGMLHAIKLGKLELFEERYKKASLTGTVGELGREEWAYIPKNVLPYLRYATDMDYCHIYSVDLTPYIFDASIGVPAGCAGDYWDCTKDETTWKTIIIGGMRQGGACKNACTSDINNDGIIDETDCIVTPDTDLGYSSYFALDITDTSDPQLLWEFSNEDIPAAELATGGLGSATSGPAVVRISAKRADGVTPDHDKNGRWFVVFGSGPTGPVDRESHMFRGFSDQPLKIFILDLATGQLLRTINARTALGDTFRYAFSGSMMDAPFDFDQNETTSEGFYQDDALYFGFVRSEDNVPDYDDAAEPTRWNVGGVLRLFTKNSLNPDSWALSKVIDNIGPVIAAVAKLQNYDDDPANPSSGVWLFFGEGRYFYKIADDIDDAQPVDAGGSPINRMLYGIKEPCYAADTGVDFNCTALAAAPNVVSDASSATATVGNWAIELDLSAGSYESERSVTDTLSTPIGAVFFTTTKPTSDVCGFGGGAYLWGVKYDTGGEVASRLKGRAIMQVSTGSIEEVDLKTAFVERGNRRTTAIQGIPPSGAPPGILVPPKPTNRFIHIFEK